MKTLVSIHAPHAGCDKAQMKLAHYRNVGCKWQTEPYHIINLHYPFGDSLHGATDYKGTYGKRSETIY